jgi:hypothetical protein
MHNAAGIYLETRYAIFSGAYHPQVIHPPMTVEQIVVSKEC